MISLIIKCTHCGRIIEIKEENKNKEVVVCAECDKEVDVKKGLQFLKDDWG